MSSRARAIRTLAILAPCLLILIVTANWGVAQPKPPTSSLRSGEELRLRGQERLIESGDRLDQAAMEGRFSGFAGTLIDEANKATRLHWKGQLPRQMLDVIADLRDQGYAIDVKSAAFSLAELDSDAQRIADLRQQETGVRITSVGPLEDYSGLMVSVSRPDEVARAAITVTSKYPLRFRVMPESRPLFSRQDDVPPFYGGGNILRADGGGSCSTGFAVQNASGERLLTARHCGSYFNWSTPQGRYVGTSAGGSASSDANVLYGEDYSASIYVGPWDSGANRAVGSRGDPQDESLIFVSGALSGYHVVRVKEINVYETVNGVRRGPGFITLDEEGDGSAGKGDSGGPVGNNNTAYTRVIARGMIDRGYSGYEAPCEGFQGGRTCYRRVYHINIMAILSALTVEVMTQP